MRPSREEAAKMVIEAIMLELRPKFEAAGLPIRSTAKGYMVGGTGRIEKNLTIMRMQSNGKFVLCFSDPPTTVPIGHPDSFNIILATYIHCCKGGCTSCPAYKTGSW